MPRKGKKHKPRRTLHPRQLAFIDHYIAGKDGVRGLAGASWEAAGYTSRGNAAMCDGTRALRNPVIAAEIARLRAKAEERVIRKMVPWIEMAPEAQDVLIDVMRGVIPSAEAKHRLAAARDAIDRAEGKPISKVQVAGDLGLTGPQRLVVEFVDAPPSS